MKFNKKSLAAGVAGVSAAAILLGGSTLALWSDSVTLDGGTISSGNLDVVALANTSWMDESPELGGVQTPINLASYKIVPGDVISKTQDVDVALEGNNMKATLSLTGAGLSGLLGDATATDVDATETGGTQDDKSTKGVTIKYTVTDEAGVVVVPETAAGTDKDISLTPADVKADTDTIKDYTVKVTATFDSTTDERTRAEATTALSNMGVTLTQKRPV